MDEAAPHAARGETGARGVMVTCNGVYLPKWGGTHQAFPVRGTYVAAASGEPAKLMNPADYPIVAECHQCGKPIRLAMPDQMEWTHIPPDAVSGAP